MQRLFVYGTLEFEPVVRKVLGRSLKGEPAWLHGYARYLLINKEYPGIVTDAACVVDGVLYQGITPQYFRLLDRYEDNIYRRQRVEVVNAHGEQVEAWAYVVPPRFRRVLSSKPWRRDVFENNQLKRFINVRCG
ncbi:MAG: gamma-glutamylcyclotransferase [Gammaproteobacteria bacterium]|jgi:gamma-glutamylcyclotransferase (GGCT)/AIG2-like uncharacterized protein YtfP